jgi:hypothetical protein
VDCGLVIVAADKNTGPGNVVCQVYEDRTGTADRLEEWGLTVYNGFKEVAGKYKIPINRIYGCADTGNNERTYHISIK